MRLVGIESVRDVSFPAVREKEEEREGFHWMP